MAIASTGGVSFPGLFDARGKEVIAEIVGENFMRSNVVTFSESLVSSCITPI